MRARDSLELPVSRSRVIFVLLLDAILLGAGGFLIHRHFTKEVVAVTPPVPTAPRAAATPVASIEPDAAPELAVVREPDASRPVTPSPTTTTTTTPAPTPTPTPTPPVATEKPRPPVARPPSTLPQKPPALPDPGKPSVPPEPVASAPDAAPPPPVEPATPDAAPGTGVTEPPEIDAATETPDEPDPAGGQTPDAAPATPTPGEEPPRDRAWVEAMTRGIRQVVENHRDVIEECYRRAAKASSQAEPLQGRLDVHLTIVTSGDADDVRVVENQTGSEELGACIVGLMRTWKYPAPGAEPMSFVWPFTFQGR